jgi:hypothetical protein
MPYALESDLRLNNAIVCSNVHNALFTNTFKQHKETVNRALLQHKEDPGSQQWP